jgi:hypothetical protein
VNLVIFMPDFFSQDFVETRRASAVRYRIGESGAIVRLIAVIAGSVERAGAAVQHWAAGNGETDTVPHGMMRVR